MQTHHPHTLISRATYGLGKLGKKYTVVKGNVELSYHRAGLWRFITLQQLEDN